RNSPPEMMWKPIQITASAPTMPSMRVSSSVALRKRWAGLLLTAEAPCGGALEVTSVILVSSARPALAGPARERRGRSNRGADRDYIAVHTKTTTVPGCTPWQTTSLETQPASITTFRLSLVIGTGFRNRAFI